VKDGVFHRDRLEIGLQQDLKDNEGKEDDVDVAEVGKGRSFYTYRGLMLPKLLAVSGYSVNHFLSLTQ
jgi:hypothetical protein